MRKNGSVVWLLRAESKDFAQIKRGSAACAVSPDPTKHGTTPETRITLRGFKQNQRGIMLGDMSDGNTNGLYISRAIIADTIATSRVSQGAGALGTASTSNLSGMIGLFSRAP